MRIAIVSPYSTGPMRGNIITARRIADCLAGSGVEATTLTADTMSLQEMLNSLRVFSPDIIHAFHAHHCGPIACSLASVINRPFVITITGSDMNEPAYCMAPATRNAMAAASAIVCFSCEMAETVVSHFPEASGKLEIIPQGVESLPVPDRLPFHIPAEAFVLLLPAALRPVKQIEFAITATTALTGQIKNLLLLIAGGAIDPAYSADIRQLLKTSPQATWSGEIPHDEMGSLYSRADIVLNCSAYEEMPNSLLEAMALGRPVLANDIAGNSSLIDHGRTGWLFNGEADFLDRIMFLYNNRNLHNQIGEQARQHALTVFSPSLEAERYISLYDTIRGTGCISDTMQRNEIAQN